MRHLSLIGSSLLFGIAAVSGCSSDDPIVSPGPRDSGLDSAPRPANTLKATIRRTAYGIPHVLADDFASAGAGLGYAQAQDAVCIIADQMLMVRSERAKYLGAGTNNANIESDFAYLGLGVHARAEAAYPQQSQTIRDMVEGFAVGYNHYLAMTPAARLPAPCTGANWVKPITAGDLFAYYNVLAMLQSSIALQKYIANAQPPDVKLPVGKSSGGTLEAHTSRSELGSNGWALGADRVSGARGMLLANPHFPWEGGLRFYESQLTVPGKLDVYGASLLAVPVINIGFNRQVAWTHTIATAMHSTIYRLTPTADDPTAYVYDGQVRKMTSQAVSIDVLQTEGSTSKLTRTFWRTHYGPMLSGEGIPWTKKVAYSMRDGNEANQKFGEQWLRMDMARSLEDLEQVDRDVHGVPWVNTIATTAAGQARYVDASRVPNLSAETVRAYKASLQTDADTKALEAARLVLLNGSTSRDEWVGGQGDAALVPAANAPSLVRPDFVMNANDTATFTNPAAVIDDIPMMYGGLHQIPTARTRMNLRMLTETDDAGASGADGRFTLTELQNAVFSNRSWHAEAIRAAIAARCANVSTVSVNGIAVDIRAACAALAAWDGRLELDRAGAVVWRELLALFTVTDRDGQGALYAQPFDPKQPAQTPRGLTPAPAAGPDPLLEKLGEAVLNLGKAGIAVDARLGDVQWAKKGDSHIPIHGGVGDLEGVVNSVGFGTTNLTLLPMTTRAPVISGRSGLTKDGYPISYGSSFVLTLAFTDSGPRAAALLTYSESADPSSPHFADQTKLFSSKTFRPVLFENAEIEADPSLQSERLEIERPAALSQ